MTSKALMILCSAVVLLSIGATPGSRPSARWEYGIYAESAGSYDWQDAGQRVQSTNMAHFFDQMGLPSNSDINIRPSRVTALVLNRLGQQGWELVEVGTADANGTYWFKRPR
jgi:hypothetical protein